MNIDDILSSPIHAKIAKFFYENRASIDTPRGVATWVREDRSTVKKALDELTAAHVLDAHKASSTTGYSFTQNNTIASKIGRFFKSRKL